MPICPTCRAACDEAATRCPADGTPLASTDPLLGKIVGDRYRLLARIGEGGMGTVYRAEHVVLRKRVAVKVLRPELSDDEDLVRRFQQEAIAASQIGQENIVDVTDFGRTAQGSLYFVMEELDGESLASILHRGGRLPVDRAVPILAQVCRALGAAHGRGIVHRDLKPDNVIVVRREDGSDLAKVVDFGIAKSGTRPERGRLTRAGTIIGTPEYMAPEQAAAANVDHRADVYAFGVLAYELLTGQLPFRGESAIATLLEHQTKPPLPPTKLRPDLPPALEALVLKAMGKRPEARQQTMAEVAADLRPVLAELGLPPVYDRPPTPPPILLSAPTRRLDAVPGEAGPDRTSPVPRGVPTPRGGTVSLDASRAPPPGAVTRRSHRSRAAPRRGRVVVASVLGLALAIGGAAALSWRWRAEPPRPAGPAAGDAAGARVGADAAPQAAPPSAREAAPKAAASPAAATPAGHAAAVRNAPRSAALQRQATPARGPGRTARGDRKLGVRPGTDENPYQKLDDLKPDPF